jgi:hypothetical protein
LRRKEYRSIEAARDLMRRANRWEALQVPCLKKRTVLFYTSTITIQRKKERDIQEDDRVIIQMHV